MANLMSHIARTTTKYGAKQAYTDSHVSFIVGIPFDVPRCKQLDQLP